MASGSTTIRGMTRGTRRGAGGTAISRRTGEIRQVQVRVPRTRALARRIAAGMQRRTVAF